MILCLEKVSGSNHKFSNLGMCLSILVGDVLPGGVVLAVLAKHVRVVALFSVSTEIKPDTVLQLAFLR
jgi:hypothetical protein